MGDVRYVRYYEEVRGAEDPAAAIRALSDDGVISALAAASQARDPYLANVLATEAMNRVHEKDTIISSAGEGVYTLDARGRVSFLNPAAEELLGWTRDEILGQDMHGTIHASFHDDDVPREACRVLLAMRQQERTQTFDDVFRHKDGQVISVAYTAAPVVREGETEGVVVVFRDITERKRAEIALRASEQRYRNLFESAHDAILVSDLNRTIIDMNPAAEALFSYPRERMVGRSTRILFESDGEYERVGRLLRDPSRHGEFVELRLKKATGHAFLGEVRYFAINDEAGDHTGFVGVVRDVTEEKRAKERLQARERQQAAVAELGIHALRGTNLQTLEDKAVRYVAEVLSLDYCKVLELLPDGHGVKLVAGVGWSPGLVGDAVVGTELDSQAGYTLRSTEPVVVEDLRTETRFRGPPLLREHGVVSGMSVIIHGDEGPYGVLGAHTRTHRAFTRDDVNFLQAVANVISTAVHRKRSEMSLRASEARTRAILDAALDAIVTTDAEDRILEFNPAAEQLFGLSREEALGREMAELIIPERYRERHRRGLARYLQTGLPHILDQRIEYPALKTDGTEFDAEITVTKLPGADHPPRGPLFTGFIRDVTAKKEAEAVLLEREAQYRLLVEGVKDYAIFLLDPEGRIVTWNEGAQRIKGWTEDEILGRSIDLFYTPEDQEAGLPRKLLEEAERDGHAEREGWRVRKDGTRFWADVLVTAVRDETGTLLGFSKVTRDLTNRVKGEQALRSSRAQLEAIVDNSLAIIYVKDPEGKFLLVNRKFEEFFGISRDEAKGYTDFDLFSREAAERYVENDRCVLDTGESLEFEEVVPREDGARTYISLKFPLKDKDGAVVAVAGISTDITDRKRVEAALLESEQRHKSLFERNPDPIFEFDLEGRFLTANPACERITGYAPEELLGSPWTRLVPEDELTPTWEAFLRAASGEAVVLDTAITHKDGRRVDVCVRGFPQVKDGEVVGVWGIADDVTESRRREAEIMESEERYRSLFDNSPDAVYVFDLEGRFLQANPACESLTGYGVEELMDMTWEPLIAPDDLDASWRAFRMAAAGETAEYEVAIHHKDGHCLDIRGTSFPQIRDGEVVGVWGIARDVTDHKRWEQELQRLNKELENRVQERTAELASANRELEAFSYTVSHDLRAPLRGIDALSQALAEDYGASLDLEGQGLLERIRSESGRLTQLVNDLLTLSRATRGELRRERVDLSEIARDVAANLRSREPGRDVAVHVEDGLACKGDPRLIRVVLENLLGNAWKFTHGVEGAEISFVGGDRVDGHRAFLVRDNGVGFDPSEAGRLFQAFQRLHRPEAFEGTGVGLATVKRIVERHGGRVHANGKPGAGATFCVELPLVN